MIPFIFILRDGLFTQQGHNGALFGKSSPGLASVTDKSTCPIKPYYERMTSAVAFRRETAQQNHVTDE